MSYLERTLSPAAVSTYSPEETLLNIHPTASVNMKLQNVARCQKC